MTKSPIPEETIFYRKPIPDKMLKMGDIRNKVAVPIDSRTTLFIKKKSDAAKIKRTYRNHMKNAFRPPVLKGANHKSI